VEVTNIAEVSEKDLVRLVRSLKLEADSTHAPKPQPEAAPKPQPEAAPKSQPEAAPKPQPEAASAPPDAKSGRPLRLEHGGSELAVSVSSTTLDGVLAELARAVACEAQAIEVYDADFECWIEVTEMDEIKDDDIVRLHGAKPRLRPTVDTAAWADEMDGPPALVRSPSSTKGDAKSLPKRLRKVLEQEAVMFSLMPPAGCTLLLPQAVPGASAARLLRWSVRLQPGGAYKDLSLELLPHENHPAVEPAVSFASKVFHPNVHPMSGAIPASLLASCRNKDKCIIAVCGIVMDLLKTPQTDGPGVVNPDAASLFTGDPEAFRKRVSEFAAD